MQEPPQPLRPEAETTPADVDAEATNEATPAKALYPRKSVPTLNRAARKRSPRTAAPNASPADKKNA